jgi:hypothetical protein
VTWITNSGRKPSTSELPRCRLTSMRGALSRKFRSILAFGLVLWCAGAGCILLSYAHGAAMSSIDSAPASSGTNRDLIAAAAGSHGCCKAHHSSAKHHHEAPGPVHISAASQFAAGFEQVALPESPAPAGATSCCPLTSGSFVTASRAQLNDSNHALIARIISLPPTLTNSGLAPDYSIRLPNLNQTYLRDCVFLIVRPAGRSN